MKQIALSKLSLRNFKGVRQFDLLVNGKNAKVFGDNAQGKTTIFDGFTWLLFDKDSQNKKDFQIKTLDSDGNVLHHLEHEVEAVLIVDGNSVTLRKVFSEKWTKKRGSASQEFSGHTTDYYIDGVPVKKSEHSGRIDDIITEDVFKLLTSPTYFNEHLKWQDRRKLLLEICGDISNDDVIASNEALAKLPAILGNRSIEDHRKVIAAKRADINKELDKIPVRIDEVHRSMPDTSELDEKKLQQQIDIIKGRIESKESELSRIQSGGEISVKEKHLREIEGDLLQIKNQLQADTLEKVSLRRQELMNAKNETSEIRRQISDKKWTIERNEKNVADLKADADFCRKKWHEVSGRTFEQHHDDNCPTCGQSLPEDQVKSAHEKALAYFNREKSKELESITSKGKSAAMESRKLEQQNVDLSQEIESLNQQLQVKDNEIHVIETDLNDLQASVKDVEDDLHYSLKKQELAAVQQEINNLRSSTQESLSAVKDEIVKLRAQVNLLEQDQSKFAQVQASTKRIDDLKQQEKKLAAEFEQLENQLFLTEEFIRTKVSMLESKINGKFKYARFRLFESQINGGLSEVCETLYGGVPYSSGLNNAARINVGLDIIATLSEHYGFTAPIFVDNAEAVTKLIETKGQTICLVVSEADKKLRVEINE